MASSRDHQTEETAYKVCEKLLKAAAITLVEIGKIDPKYHLKIAATHLLEIVSTLDFSLVDVAELKSYMDATANLITEPSIASIESYEQITDAVLQESETLHLLEAVHRLNVFEETQTEELPQSPDWKGMILPVMKRILNETSAYIQEMQILLRRQAFTQLISANRMAYHKLLNAVADSEVEINDQLEEKLAHIEKTLKEQQDPYHLLKLAGLALLKKCRHLKYTADELPKLTSYLEITANLITKPEEFIDGYKKEMNEVDKIKRDHVWGDMVHAAMQSVLAAASAYREDQLEQERHQVDLKLEAENREENVELLSELELANREAFNKLLNAVAHSELKIKSNTQLELILANIEKYYTLEDGQQDPKRHLKMAGLALLKNYRQLEYIVADLPKLTIYLDATAELITEPSPSIDSYKDVINDLLKIKRAHAWGEAIHKSMLSVLLAARRKELLALYETSMELWLYTLQDNQDPNHRLKNAGIEQLKKVLQSEYIFDDIPTLTEKLNVTANLIKSETTHRTKLFTIHDKLAPRDIYRSTIGMFEKFKFTLLHVVEGNSPPDDEAARVYQKVEGGRLYIIYPPGNNTDDIRSKAKKGLKKKFSSQDLRQAKKIAVVCESNISNQDLNDQLSAQFNIYEIKQYIKVDLDEKVSPTEMSISKHYNETESSHYCLEAIRRDLTSEEMPIKKIDITQEMLDQQNDYYEAYQLKSLERKLETIARPNLPKDSNDKKDEIDGSAPTTTAETASTTTSTTTTLSQADLANIKLPVSGHIGSKATDCSIGIDLFKAELEKHTEDRHLEVIVKNNSADKIILWIYTNKPSIALFSNLGIKQQTDKRGFKYYPIEILPQDKRLAPEPTDPLLGIIINDERGQKKSIDVTSLFNTDDIRHFIKQGETSPVEHTTIAATTTSAVPNPIDSILAAIQNTNIYLTKRATATNWVLTCFFNSYTGSDYYQRRDSWLRILKEVNKCLDGEISKVHLQKFIFKEANHFNVGFSKNYYNHLTKLNEAITNSNVSNLDERLKPKVHAYHQMYTQMKMYKASTLKYMKRDAAIEEQDSEKRKTLLQDEMDAVAREKLLYEAQYNALDPNDRKYFLSTKEEHISEYHNLDNLGKQNPYAKR